MQKVDLSFFKIGLKNQVFIPYAVIDLLYNPLKRSYYPSKSGNGINGENRWQVSNFKSMPQKVRRDLVKEVLEASKDDMLTNLTIEMADRILCALCTLLDETDRINSGCSLNKVAYICEYDYSEPEHIVHEIYLWHCWGIGILSDEKEVLRKIWKKITEDCPEGSDVEDFVKNKKSETARLRTDLAKQSDLLDKKERILINKQKEVLKQRTTGAAEFGKLEIQHQQTKAELNATYNRMAKADCLLGLFEVYPIIKEFAPEILK